MSKVKKTIKLEDLKEKVNKVVLSQEMNDDEKAGWCEAYVFAAIQANNYHGFAFVDKTGRALGEGDHMPRPHQKGYYQRKYF
jgi:ribosomal protein L1